MTPVQLSQKSLVNDSNEYVLREPADLPGVTIDTHQKKHTPNWPGKYEGKPGSAFPKNFGIKDTIALGQVIIKNISLFNNPNLPINTPESIPFEIKEYKKELKSDGLYKKLKGVEAVHISPGFNLSTYTWYIHFYPKFE